MKLLKIKIGNSNNRLVVIECAHFTTLKCCHISENSKFGIFTELFLITITMTNKFEFYT